MLELPALLDTQLESEVLESEAQEAVLDTLGDVFTEPSELEVVCEEALDSTDQDERSNDRGRVDFSARFLLRVPILYGLVSSSGSEL